MKDDRFQRLEELFLAASRLEPDQRAEFLDRACAEDASLRAEIEGLLAQDTDPHELMKTLAFGKGVQRAAVQALDAAATDPTEEGSRQDSPHVELPQRIGAYRIIRRIGAGGMGVVYEAEQEHPRRLVALKVIRHGLASRSAMRRFEHESQILARLRHPGIAQVYEAGTHHDVAGTVPFFAMEYLADAKPITAYADTKGLSTGQKLQLFVQVCEAVHHGHQKGIIHRDLKPSNILVDAQGRVKIIDFGVARSTDADLAITTQQTDIGQIVGTLQYMSPEQCEGDPNNLDTRSDVYALGVVLYELLSGKLPYSVGLHDALRIIREEHPTRLTALDRTFDKDIETIVFKALEKERDQRYASAMALAEDIRAYLQGEPIRARPQSTVYVLRKFVKRNRMLVALTLAVFLALISGIVASTTFAVKARRAEQETRQQKYVANIKAAEFALSANEVEAAQRQLIQAPTELRDWEWQYLRAACDTSLLALRGHDGSVHSTAFSADGSRLLSASIDGTVCAWDLETGSKLWTNNYVSVDSAPIALNRDGSLVAIGTSNGTVRIFRTPSGEEQVVLPVQLGLECVADGNAIAFSPDGSRVAIGLSKGPVTIWSVQDGTMIAHLQGHESYVGCIAFSRDGRKLATGGFNDMSIRVWEIADSRELIAFRGRNDGGFYAVAFSPDGKRLASASQDNTIRIWNAADGRELLTFPRQRDDVTSVAFNSDGSRLASGTARGTIRIWDLTVDDILRAELVVLPGHQGAVGHLVFSSDGAFLASGSGDKSVRVWDGAGYGSPTILRGGHSQAILSVAFSPDGRYLASAGQDGEVVWDLTERRLVATQSIIAQTALSVAFSPDSRLIATAQGGNSILLWDWREHRVVSTLYGHTDSVTDVEFSPDGGFVASASADDTIRLWDVSLGREFTKLEGHTDGVLSAAFSPNGKRVVSSSLDGTVRSWNIRDGSELWRREFLGNPGYAAFTPGGARVVSFGGEDPVTFRDASTGEETLVLKGTRTGRIAFNPDSTRLGCTLRDSDLHLLDAKTGDDLLHFRGHDGERVHTVAFSPDGTRIASAGHDQTVHIWDIVPYRIRYMERKAAEAMKDGVVDQAELLDRRVLMEIRAVLGNDHRGTLAPLRRLVESLIAQDKFAEAEPLAVECYQRSEAAYPAKNGNILTALNLVIDLYERWGRPDQAIKWREELALTSSERAEG